MGDDPCPAGLAFALGGNGQAYLTAMVADLRSGAIKTARSFFRERCLLARILSSCSKKSVTATLKLIEQLFGRF